MLYNLINFIKLKNMALVNLIYDPEEFIFKREMNPKVYDTLEEYYKQLKVKDTIVKIRDGVYEYWDSNDIEIPGYKSDSSFVNDEGRYTYLPYGVCDNPDQIFERDERIQQYIDDPNHDFIIQMHYISKKQQPEKWGWRWHKWGRYIGEHEITCEYLYDEPIVEGVWLYSMTIVEKV